MLFHTCANFTPGVTVSLASLYQVKDSTGLAKEDYRQKLWAFIVKKEIPKMAKLFSTSRHNTLISNKKVMI